MGPRQRATPFYGETHEPYRLIAAVSENDPIAALADFDDELRALATPCPAREPHATEPQPPSPRMEPLLGPNPGELFYHTSASMKDVCSVTLCRREEFITGMIVHYTDGRRASLGLVRLDRLDDVPTGVTATKGLWFYSNWHRSHNHKANFSGIQRVATAGPTEDEDSCLRVPCRGVAEWWFVGAHSEVHFEGRSSVPARAVGL